MSDERVIAAAQAIQQIRAKWGREVIENPLNIANKSLEAADRSDREQGIHRVKVDDATVEKVARALFLLENPDGSWAKHNAMFEAFSKYEHAARAVLAALTGAES